MGSGTDVGWEKLLALAPLSISLMGQVIFVATSLQDYAIDKNPGALIKYPESFQATLMQVCNSMSMAFREAHGYMDQIRLRMQQVGWRTREMGSTRGSQLKKSSYTLTKIPKKSPKIPQKIPKSEKNPKIRYRNNPKKSEKIQKNSQNPKKVPKSQRKSQNFQKSPKVPKKSPKIRYRKKNK